MKDVVIYGRSEPPCSGCTIVKTALDSSGIIYTYKDTSEESAYEEMCKLRVRSIPAVFVEGVFKQGADNIQSTIKEILLND